MKKIIELCVYCGSDDINILEHTVYCNNCGEYSLIHIKDEVDLDDDVDYIG